MSTTSFTTRGARTYDLGKMGLKELVPAYFSYPAVQAYLALSAAAIAGAVHFGILAHPVRLVLAALASIVMYPLIWYFLHRCVLHSRFLYKFPATAKLWKRIHYDHHQDPNRLDVLFGSLTNTLPTIAVATLPVGYAIGGWGAALTAAASALICTCIYEFGHCIQHLNYQPKNAYLVKIKKLHMAHHFHDEDGNFGILAFWVDKLFGTYYEDMAARPRSPTVHNLGYDDAEAALYPWVAAISPEWYKRRKTAAAKS